MYSSAIILPYCGEMAERSKAPPWKGGIGATLSRVRIPLSPPVVSIFSPFQAIGYMIGFIRLDNIPRGLESKSLRHTTYL
jgi:hypothetical protein